MAVNMNTTKTVKRTSTVLGKRCEQTLKNMARLIEKSGCLPDVPMEKVTVPMNPGDRDDVVFVSLNGADFYFYRGVPVSMPSPVAKILRNAGMIV